MKTTRKKAAAAVGAEKKIRTERTLSVREEKLSPEKVAALAQLRSDPRYEALLDVLEMRCILAETELINCPSDEKERILAKHTLSKAFWQVFTWVQTQVDNAHRELTGQVVSIEEVSEEEAENRRILGTL